MAQTTEKGSITIRVYNLNGQQQITRNVAVNDNFNSITITEAARLVKGMYVVQVIRDNKLITTEKIIKQ